MCAEKITIVQVFLIVFFNNCHDNVSRLLHNLRMSYGKKASAPAKGPLTITPALALILLT